MPDDTLPLKIQSTMTQNPSWMMRELVESSKFQTFPPRRIRIRLVLPKNPHPLGAKIGSKLKQFNNNPTVFNTIGDKNCLPSTYHWINSGIGVCAALCLQSLRFIQKKKKIQNKLTPGSSQSVISALRSLTAAPECAKVRRKHTRGSPSAASAFLRTRG